MHAWSRALESYRRHDNLRAVFEALVTLVPFVALWAASWWAFASGHWWLSALISVPAAAFLVRLFMIQHDCGHGSFFSSRRVSDWVGRTLGVLTLTPYGVWKRTHALHHATCGNLDRRGIGDINTLTVSEYRSLSPLGRLGYRIYRHPLVLFGIGPAYLFFLQHRVPVGLMRSGWRPWLSSQGTNISVAAVIGGMIWLIGPFAFAFVYLPIMLLAASTGVWLFYVQHQFEHTSWEDGERWQYVDAALHGSSFYDLPPVLRWMTANIGVHHVHHLCSRVPYHRLMSVVEAFPQLRSTGRITLGESFSAVRLTLWDEANRRLISFDDLKTLPVHESRTADVASQQSRAA
ncbi:MAG: fatty acid desaturase [Beijerinckiaceae bacterium]|nr:fatty acid desaturase [Beijerinckiaceae bacterium]